MTGGPRVSHGRGLREGEAQLKVQILGSGCPNCRALERNVRRAAAEAGIEVELEKITDPDRIMDMGVMMTPALAVDGNVKSSGKVLRPDEIAAILESQG